MTARSIFFVIMLSFGIVQFPYSSFAGEVGAFSHIEGRVDVLREGASAAVPAGSGDRVYMGDIVRTKSDGRGEIAFKDGTVMKLAPETRMKIDEYSFAADNGRNRGVMSLFRGKVRAIVSRASSLMRVGSGSTFDVRTPTAVMGVRGTDVFVFHDKGVTGVVFKEGHGFVYNQNLPGKLVNLGAGQATFVPKHNAPPQTPRSVSSGEMTQHTKDTSGSDKPAQENKQETPKDNKNTTVETKTEQKEKGKEDGKQDAPKDGKSAEQNGGGNTATEVKHEITSDPLAEPAPTTTTTTSTTTFSEPAPMPDPVSISAPAPLPETIATSATSPNITSTVSVVPPITETIKNSNIKVNIKFK